MAAQAPKTVPRFSSPQEQAMLTLLRSADCLHRAFQQRLKPHGLTATQYNVLRILRTAQPGGLTCSAIGSRMIAPEPDITRVLTRLKTQKLVTQKRDDHDRRVVWTHLSAQGVATLARLEGLVEQAPKELLRGLTCDEVAQLTGLLAKAQCCGAAEPAREQHETVTAKQPFVHWPRSSPLRRRPE